MKTKKKKKNKSHSQTKAELFVHYNTRVLPLLHLAHTFLSSVSENPVFKRPLICQRVPAAAVSAGNFLRRFRNARALHSRFAHTHTRRRQCHAAGRHARNKQPKPRLAPRTLHTREPFYAESRSTCSPITSIYIYISKRSLVHGNSKQCCAFKGGPRARDGSEISPSGIKIKRAQTPEVKFSPDDERESARETRE